MKDQIDAYYIPFAQSTIPNVFLTLFLKLSPLHDDDDVWNYVVANGLGPHEKIKLVSTHLPSIIAPALVTFASSDAHS